MSVPVIAYHRGMSRWEPDARGRLERVAMELFVERGFEQTTVAEIAQRAGLTERTFFRHFADKREVLFSGAGALAEFLVRAVAQAPDSSAPLDAARALIMWTRPSVGRFYGPSSVGGCWSRSDLAGASGRGARPRTNLPR